MTFISDKMVGIMNDPSQRVMPMLLAVSFGAFFLLRILSGPQNPQEQNPPEPPLISPSIPYIGHAIGIMRRTSRYYVQLSQRCLLPIFTLDVLGSKVYIVTSLDLVQAIQKKPKVLAFPPIGVRFASRILGISAEAIKAMKNNINGEEGEWGLSMELHGGIRLALGAGPDLDRMNREMVQSIAASLDRLEVSTDKAKLKLAKWVRRNVTIATTNSVYGPQNPFKDESIADAFWVFEHKLLGNLVSVLPVFSARKGIAARTKLAKAFEHYFRIQGHKNASLMVRNRYQACVSGGMGAPDVALCESGASIGVLNNTVPASFWMLLFVNSHPGLLNDIREELDSVVTKKIENGLVRCLDITLLKTNCPLLISTFQEVLRYRASSVSVREVMQDTVLDGQWLLKKGSMVQMPSRVFHSDSILWGADKDEFNPRRFMNDGRPKSKRTDPAAFRAFGGGATLCPGRHFATNEVLAVASMFIMRYDMTPTQGFWSVPKTYNTHIAAGIMEPDTDVEVEISIRKGFEDGRWAYDVKDSDEIFAIVAEDHADIH